jgi:hypothetical protein
MKCINCGIEYKAKRSTSKYCSDKCKLAYHRVIDDTVKFDTVTASSSVTLTPHASTYTGGDDCGCGMCNNKVVNKSSKTINHGAWKSASELKDNEINRVPIPGDDDYDGCMVYKDGAWFQKLN